MSKRSRSDLHAYQHRAIAFIKATPGAALFLDLGLGKTVSTLYALQDLHDALEMTRTLVIAPLRVATSVWPAEIAAWEGITLDYAVACGSAQQRIAAVNKRATLTIINRENIPWLVEYLLENKLGWPFDCVVVDELSSFKSPKARRFRALKAALPKIDRVIGLTGTPASNGLIDLWSQVYLLDRGARLGKTVTGYRGKYFDEQPWIHSYVLKAGAEEKIYAAIQDISLSMQSADYLDLPPLVVNDIAVDLPPAVRAQYRSLEKTMLLELEAGGVKAANAAVLSGKLQQIANGTVFDSEEVGVWHVVHDAKLDALAEIIEDSGSPVLVAYSHTPDRDRILARFPQAVFLDKRPETIESWNRGEIPVLVAHPASAGHGLNLQKGGCIMAWYGLPWSLELYQQMAKRLHRQGQERRVIMHRLIASGTVDETIVNALESKDTTQAALLDALKADVRKRTQKT